MSLFWTTPVQFNQNLCGWIQSLMFFRRSSPDDSNVQAELRTTDLYTCGSVFVFSCIQASTCAPEKLRLPVCFRMIVSHEEQRPLEARVMRTVKGREPQVAVLLEKGNGYEVNFRFAHLLWPILGAENFLLVASTTLGGVGFVWSRVSAGFLPAYHRFP